MVIRYATQSSPPTRKAVDAQVNRAKAKIAEKLKRGRPASGNETVTLRISAETVAFFKAQGDGWKTEMARALDKAAHR